MGSIDSTAFAQCKMFHTQLGTRFSEMRASPAYAAVTTQRRSFAMHFHVQQQALMDVGPAFQHAIQFLPGLVQLLGVEQERAV